MIKNLKEARKELSMSQVKFAAAIGLSQAAVSNYETYGYYKLTVGSGIKPDHIRKTIKLLDDAKLKHNLKIRCDCCGQEIKK